MRKQFLIIETTAEHCRGYNRAAKGRETIRKVEADSAPEALQNWLSEMAEVYKISWVQEKYKSGFVKDSDPQLYVWQEGDHSADFGDFVVHVETIMEEPKQHEYSINIQFTTTKEFSPKLLNDILSACIIQVKDVNVIDCKAEIK